MHTAAELKKQLEAKVEGLRVVLTRYSGETVDALQNATFANRLNVNLYVSLGFYETKQKIPKLYLYHLVYNPATDFWIKKSDA